MTEAEYTLILGGIERVERGLERLQGLFAEGVDRLDHLDDCVDGCKGQISQLEALIRGAVPNGDVRGHHDYHLIQMRRWNFWSKIKSSVAVKLFEWAAVGTAGWVLLTLWGGLKIVIAQ